MKLKHGRLDGQVGVEYSIFTQKKKKNIWLMARLVLSTRHLEITNTVNSYGSWERAEYGR
jgi:hypothetical protein